MFGCGKVGIDIEKENAIVDEFANQIRYYYSALNTFREKWNTH